MPRRPMCRRTQSRSMTPRFIAQNAPPQFRQLRGSILFELEFIYWGALPPVLFPPFGAADTPSR